MLNSETFGRGLQMINAVCVKQIETQDQIDIMFMLLKDLDNKCYLQGIINLLKEKINVQNPPSPAEIRIAVEKISAKKYSSIFDCIRNDIILYGNQQNYKPAIKRAIEIIGGWDKLRFATESEMNILEKEFAKAYDKEEQLLLSNNEEKASLKKPEEEIVLIENSSEKIEEISIDKLWDN